MKIRVLIVDDHGVVRTGLRMYLGTDPRIEVVGEARDGQEAVELARQLRPHVVLMDLIMPVMDGIAATAAICGELPNVEVVALTSVVEDAAVADAVRAGALGYMLKDAESEDLITAIVAAANGKSFLSPRALARLVRDVATPETPPDALTGREIEVLRLLADGRSNREIAVALAVSEQTVKSHVSHIFAKLGVCSRTQAALYAIQTGIARNGGGVSDKVL